MDKSIRLNQFWAWLPAFRVVAEAESLAVASRVLRVTPSALSRTVRLLEDAVGQPLFVREGRKLRLTRAGDLFLGSVRRAMRAVDDGMAAMGDHRWLGALTVAAPAWFARRFVVSALDAVRAQHDSLVPVVQCTEAPGLAAALLRGELDVGVSAEPPSDARIVARALPPLPVARYARALGAVDERRTVGVVGLDDEAELTAAEVRVTLDLAAEVCRVGGLVAVLPAAIAGDLHAIGPAHRGPLELWALTRHEPGLAGAVVEAIVAEMSR